MYVSIGDTSVVIAFSVYGGMQSGPGDLYGLQLDNMLCTP